MKTIDYSVYRVKIERRLFMDTRTYKTQNSYRLCLTV